MKKFFLYTLLVISIITSLYIVFYYLFLAQNIADLRMLPPLFLIAISLYIISQVLKRLIKKSIPWYNWFYYIGLVAILIPLPFSTVTGDWPFKVTQYGSLFLLFPQVLEFILLRRSDKPSNQNQEKNQGDTQYHPS